MDIKNFSTEELVEELANRSNVKKIAVGRYKDYELRSKYVDCIEPVESDCVLVIDVS